MMNENQKKILDLAQEGKLNQVSIRGIGKLICDDQAQPLHPQTVKYHLNQLQKKGLLFVDYKHQVVKRIDKGQIPNTNLIAIPIMGSANCGPATLYADGYVQGYLKVSSSLLNKKAQARKNSLFAIEASGNSMCSARIGEQKQPINDGDFVLIDGSDKVPNNGDYVLSVIDGLANIKRFYFEGDRVALVSESDENQPPIFIDAEESLRYLVNGIVIQVVPKPRLGQ